MKYAPLNEKDQAVSDTIKRHIDEILESGESVFTWDLVADVVRSQRGTPGAGFGVPESGVIDDLVEYYRAKRRGISFKYLESGRIHCCVQEAPGH